MDTSTSIEAIPAANPASSSQTCTGCGANVTGMKFCGECGTKVLPSNCLVCSTDLIARAKFCPECGTARGSTTRPIFDEDPVGPTAKEADPVLPDTPREVSRVADSEAREAKSEARDALSGGSEAANPASSPRDPISSTKLEAGAEPSSAEKKKFAVKQSPKCAVCSKSVYETERVVDSTGTIFHRDCFRCKTCKAHLAGRQRILEPENGSIKLATGQYLVAREGSQLGTPGDFFCDKHAIRVRASVVKSKAVDEKARDDAELTRVASMRKDQNEEARLSMQIRVGDMLPTCARCGRPIDKGQRAITTGIQKMHESCPTKEESEKAIRTARYFVRKAPDRLAGTLTCDKETKHPHTFLYELDKDALTEALKKNGNETVLIRYLPDAQARAGAQRKLVAPSSDAAREFDLSFKDVYEFSFANPKLDGAIVKPVLDKKEKNLTLTKFYHANGVLQTLVALFKYEEETRLCTAEKVEITLEMWPPEAAAEMSSQLDPLAHLKHREGGSKMEEQDVQDAGEEDAEIKLDNDGRTVKFTEAAEAVLKSRDAPGRKASRANAAKKGSCSIM